MKLIIIRHGETEENRHDIIQGHLPGVLSELGIEQARKVALRLKDEQIDFIYSSDLARAVDTAKEIAKHHPNARLVLTKALRERHVGEFEGKKHSDVGWGMISKSGETKEQIDERIGLFMGELETRHEKGNILLVGHGGSIESLIAHLLGKHFAMENGKDLKNTGITIVEIEKSGAKLHLFNCTKHL